MKINNKILILSIVFILSGCSSINLEPLVDDKNSYNVEICGEYFKDFKKLWRSKLEKRFNYNVINVEDDYWKAEVYAEIMREECWIGLSLQDLENILGKYYFYVKSKKYGMDRIYYPLEREGFAFLFTMKSLYFYLRDGRVVHVSINPQPNQL